MEEQLLSFSLPLILSAIAALSLLIYRSRNKITRLPPGRFEWPVMGETLDFLYRSPEKFVGDRMKKFSPSIFKTHIFGEPTAVICGPAGNKFLFANEQKLVTVWRPPSIQRLFRSYQTAAADSATPIPREKELQIVRSPGFLKPEALVRYLGKMDCITRQHLNMYWKGNETVKVFPLSKFFTLSLANCFFMGLEDHNRIAKLVEKFDDLSNGQHFVPLNFPGTWFYRANKAAMAIRKEIQSIIREKKYAMLKGKQMHDILSHMIMVTDSAGRSMEETEIADKVMGLVVAGYSAIAVTITFLIKYIGKRPKIYDNILAVKFSY